MILSRLLAALLVIPPVLLIVYWAFGRPWIADAFFYSSIVASAAGLLTLIGAVAVAVSGDEFPKKVVTRAALALLSPLWLFSAFFVIAMINGH